MYDLIIIGSGPAGLSAVGDAFSWRFSFHFWAAAHATGEYA